MSTRLRFFGISLAVVLSACAPTTRTADPFASAGSSGGRNRPAVRVELEVACDRCLISWSAGVDGGTTRARSGQQVWSLRLVRYPISSETIRVSAGSEDNPVQRIRILVNGSVAASVENENADPLEQLCATTVIPRLEDVPSALSGSCSGYYGPESNED